MIIGGPAIALIYGVGVVVMKRYQKPEASAVPPSPLLKAWTPVADGIDRVLSLRALQYLGMISYSLYLIHELVLERVYKLGMHLMHVNQETISNGGAVLWFILAMAASIVAADILYRLIEKPTMRFASSLKPKPQGTPGAAAKIAPPAEAGDKQAAMPGVPVGPAT